jgi:hypothetical protein
VLETQLLWSIAVRKTLPNIVDLTLTKLTNL